MSTKQNNSSYKSEKDSMDVNELIDLAATGDPKYEYALANYLLHLDDYEPTLEKALFFLKSAAEQNYSQAQNLLGYLYGKGIGLEQDYHQAFNLFTLAAEQGIGEASYNIGSMYVHGHGVEQDYLRAFDHMLIAAKQGYLDAQYEISVYYRTGQATKINMDECLRWCRIAAEGGHVLAQFNLGIHYQDGLGVRQNLEIATYWLEKAAEQGEVEAMNMMGKYYYRGVGVKKSFSKAFYFLSKSTELGDAIGQFRLAELYTDPKNKIYNLATSVHLLMKSAGQDYALAQAALSNAFLNGAGVEQDFHLAAYWAKRGYENGDLECGYNLAVFYEQGIGIAQDVSKSLDIYLKLADEEYAPALHSLFRAYYLGIGTVPNLEKADYYLRESASRGYPEAIKNLPIWEKKYNKENE